MGFKYDQEENRYFKIEHFKTVGLLNQRLQHSVTLTEFNLETSNSQDVT